VGDIEGSEVERLVLRYLGCIPPAAPETVALPRHVTQPIRQQVEFEERHSSWHLQVCDVITWYSPEAVIMTSENFAPQRGTMHCRHSTVCEVWGWLGGAGWYARNEHVCEHTMLVRGWPKRMCAVTHSC
jgi:hypothetical protein